MDLGGPEEFYRGDAPLPALAPEPHFPEELPPEVLRRSYVEYRGEDDDWPIMIICSRPEERPADGGWALDRSPEAAARKASADLAFDLALGYAGAFVECWDEIRGAPGLRVSRWDE